MQRGTVNIRERKIKRSLENDTILFIIALGLFLITVLLDYSLVNIEARITHVLRYIGYALMVFKLLKNIYVREELLKSIITLGITLAGFVVNRNKAMVLYMLVIISSVYITMEVILKTYIIIQSIVLVGVVIGSQLGLVLDYVHKDGDRVRHFLGFTYTTFAPVLFLFIILEYIAIKKGRINLLEYLIGMIVSIWLYKYTDTTFAFLISVISLTFFLISTYLLDSNYLAYTFRKIIYLWPYLCAVSSVLFTWMYNSNNTVMCKIDELIHGRLRLGHNAIIKYGFSLFGKEIEWVGYSYGKMYPQNYNYVDCDYLQVALQQGFIFLLLVIVAYSILIIISIKNRNYYLSWIVMIICIFAMTEPRLVNICLNPFVIIAFTINNRRIRLSEQYDKKTERIIVYSIN